MAQDILNQLWQTWDMAWDTIQTELRDHVLLVVGFVAIGVLFWFFLAPGMKKK